MAGWNLTQGTCTRNSISEDEIWSYFNYIFSTKSVNRTSYKYCFIKSLIENIFNINSDGYLSYYYIFDKFIETYWYLCVKYSLRQGDTGVRNKESRTKIELILDRTIMNNNINVEQRYETLDPNIRNSLIKEVTKECKRYVIGAIYGDTDGTFYEFDLKQEKLKLNLCVLEFIKKYKYVLLKINHYEWIKFLEKVNKQENTYSLGLKLDYSTKRYNLETYKGLLFVELNKKYCFYCGKPLRSAKETEVDHFIPWTFTRDDKIWNLNLSCKTCNRSKSDRLPGTRYIPRMLEQNEEVSHNNEIIIVHNEFKVYNANRIQNMYKCAVFNGFKEGWEPI